MKTVVITGSARGLGLEMAKNFRKKNYNVVISDVNVENLQKAEVVLKKIKSKAKVHMEECDVTKVKDIKNLATVTKSLFGNIDIWINNAGINQPDKAIWEVSDNAIDTLLNVDLKGTIMASKVAMNIMTEQGYGAIYNVEGHGSNDNVILGLSIYGTSKRAVTYFTEALAKEVKIKDLPIIVGKLSPGIMITDFLTNSLGTDKMSLNEKTKKVYNILGDYPDVIAEFLVNKMVNNTKNGVKFEWLTSAKAAIRFMTSAFNKRDFFGDEK